MSLIQRSCPFNSLEECLSFLTEHFPESTTEIHNATGENPDGSQIMGPRLVPRYLFRGEKEVYRTCYPKICRLDGDDRLSSEGRQDVTRVVECAVHWLSSPESNFHLSPRDAEGLVQHLGLPTRYVDFSADPQVAASFAVGDSQEPYRRAAICVLDVQRAMDSACGQIVELKDHRWCERAKRQVAYGFAPISFGDLRLTESADQAGLWWFDVTIQASDINRFRGKLEALLDGKSDPVGGLLRFVTNLYVAESGKVRPEAAKWISNEILMVPLLGRLSSDGVEFLPPNQLQRWSEEHEREMSRAYWSRECPNRTLPTDYPDQIRRGLGMFPFPCTYHPEQ